MASGRGRRQNVHRALNLGVVAAFVVLVVALVLRPQGLFGGLTPAEEP